jgi:hypothetical protein
MGNPNLNRRSLICAIGGGAIAGSAHAVPPASAPLHAELFAAFDALDRETDRLNGANAPQAVWDAWEAEGDRLYDLVEALPSTRENVPIKARAIASIYSVELPSLWEDDDATSGRLGRQIVSAYRWEGC